MTNVNSAKTEYVPPVLTAYGTVRNLTGGSKGGVTDANASVANPNMNKAPNT